jgi:hypothetical protein
MGSCMRELYNKVLSHDAPRQAGDPRRRSALPLLYTRRIRDEGSPWAPRQLRSCSQCLELTFRIPIKPTRDTAYSAIRAGVQRGFAALSGTSLYIFDSPSLPRLGRQLCGRRRYA